MTSRDRTILSVVVALAIAVGGWLLLIQPKRDQASKLQGEITAAQRQLTTANAQMTAALAAKRAYPQNYKAVAELGEAVPADDSTGALIYQLQSAAAKSGVVFRALQLEGGAGGSAAAPAARPASTTTGAAPAAASSAATLPPGAAVGPAGFPVMPFTFTFDGNFFHLANFFGRIEHFVVATQRSIAVSGRLMTLNGIGFSAGPGGFPAITATVSATTYLSQATPTFPGTGASASTTPATPVTGTSGSSSSSPAVTAPAAITSSNP
jgi:hypothetical protein